MPHVQIRRALVTILVAASCAGVSATSAAPGKDNRAIERTQGSCRKVLTRAEMEMLPTEARDFADFAAIVPGERSPVTVDFTFNAREKATFFLLDGQGLSVKTGIQRVNPDTCELLTKRTKAEFGDSGVSGTVQFLFRPDPEPWLQGTFTNLYRGRDRLSPNFKLEWRGVRNLEPQIPSDPGTPEQPGPPSQPTGPVEYAFNPGGPIVRPGTLVKMNFRQPEEHSDHELHLVDGFYLCRKFGLYSEAVVENVTSNGFQMRRTLPPGAGWEWGVWNCDRNGCSADGTFYKEPIRGTTANLQVFSGRWDVKGVVVVEVPKTRSEVRFPFEGVAVPPGP